MMALFFLPLKYMLEGSVWNGTESNVSKKYSFYEGSFRWKFTDVSILSNIVLEVSRIQPHPHRPGFCAIYRNLA